MSTEGSLERYAAYLMLEELEQDRARAEALKQHRETTRQGPAVNDWSLKGAPSMSQEIQDLHQTFQIMRVKRTSHTALMNLRLRLDDINNASAQICERFDELCRRLTHDRNWWLRKYQIYSCKGEKSVDL